MKRIDCHGKSYKELADIIINSKDNIFSLFNEDVYKCKDTPKYAIGDSVLITGEEMYVFGVSKVDLNEGFMWMYELKDKKGMKWLFTEDDIEIPFF